MRENSDIIDMNTYAKNPEEGERLFNDIFNRVKKELRTNLTVNQVLTSPEEFQRFFTKYQQLTLMNSIVLSNKPKGTPCGLDIGTVQLALHQLVALRTILAETDPKAFQELEEVSAKNFMQQHEKLTADFNRRMEEGNL